jgi:hypothetical protein
MSTHAHKPPARPATAAAARSPSFDEDTHTDLLRLDLRDVPYISPGLHVEALQPSFFSRLLGLFIR